VIPSDPYDAKGLLLQSLRQDDPVLFMEPKALYRKAKGEVPEGEYVIPFGQAKVRREGTDMTLVAWGAMVHVATEAARRAEDDGISCEVLDLRTLVPLDEETLLESVKKTGRMVVIHEAQKTSGFAGELTAIVAEKALEYLQAPVLRVTGFDTPFPYTLEDVYMPDADRVMRAILKTHRYQS
jgi:pyruvate dehydrogenase E1 component beta subunit